MKRITSLILALLLLLSVFSSCSSTKSTAIVLEPNKDAKNIINLSTPAESVAPIAPETKLITGYEDNLLDIKKHNGIGDGKADDTIAIKAALALAEKNNGIVYFPQGKYILNESIIVAENITLAFSPNASLVIGKNVVLTINSKDIYAPKLQIFAGEGVVAYMPNIKYGFPEWFGAKTSDETSDSLAIQNAMAAVDTLYFSRGVYHIEQTVTVPQSRNIVLIGSGNKSTTLMMADSGEFEGFKYVCSSDKASTLTAEHFTVDDALKQKTSIAFSFNGNNEHKDGKLTLRYIVSPSIGFVASVTYATGCTFEELDTRSSFYVIKLGAGATDTYCRRNLGVSNSGFLIADGLMPDGQSSKGIYFTNSSSVWCGDVDVNIKNFTDISFVQGGYDLGWGTKNEAALRFENVSNFKISGCWVASNGGLSFNAAVAKGEIRVGVKLVNCMNGRISGCSIVNQHTGVLISGVMNGINKDNSIIIEGNTLNGNVYKEIEANNTKYVVIESNFMMSNGNQNFNTVNLTATGNSDGIIKYNSFTSKDTKDVITNAKGFIISDNLSIQ